MPSTSMKQDMFHNPIINILERYKKQKKISKKNNYNLPSIFFIVNIFHCDHIKYQIHKINITYG